MAYPAPIYSHHAASTTGTGAVVDIGTSDMTGYPPVLISTFVGEGTFAYTVEGSHDGISFVDFSGGGFTSATAKDLIPGVRFWRTNISQISGGVFTSSVGAVPTQEGTRAMNNVIVASTVPVGT